jgi:protein CpxP
MQKQQQIVRTVAGLAGALVAAVLLVGTVAEVGAQAGQGARAGRGAGFGHFGPGGPGVFGPGRLGLAGLDLTEAQRAQVKAVMDQHRDELRSHIERVGTARRALQASAETGQVDENAAMELGAATSALAVAESRARAEVIQVLTPEQRAKLQERREEMAQRRQARQSGGADRPSRRDQ